jgi:hypothetical protein
MRESLFDIDHNNELFGIVASFFSETAVNFTDFNGQQLPSMRNYAQTTGVAGARSTLGAVQMTDKVTDPKDAKKPDVSKTGMMGDGTEEQNLDQPGNPAARIKQDEVADAFGKQPLKK